MDVTIFMICFVLFGVITTIPVILFFVSIFKIIKASKEQQEMFKSNNNNESKLCQRIWMNDVNFSAESLKQQASKCFLKIQEAWTTRNSKTLRAFVSDSLYLIHEDKIKNDYKKEEINIIEDIYVTDTEIVSYIVDGQYEILGIKLDAHMKDYVIDEQSNQIKKGTKDDIYKSYYMEFIRKKGILTKSGKEISVTECPNCGAPITVTDSGQCGYCQSVITNGSFSWVLNKLENYDEKRHKIQIGL